MFLKELLANHPVVVSDRVKSEVQRIVKDIQSILTNNPENEILDDEGRTLLQQLI